VKIFGAVRAPGTYSLHKNLTLIDLLPMAGGLTDFADSTGVEIVHTYQEPVEVVTIDARREADTFLLNPGDEVYVRRLSEARSRGTVTVTGQVVYPGDYALTEPNLRLSQIVSRAGGLTADAYAGGLSLFRGRAPATRQRVALAGKRALRGSLPHDIMIVAGDAIHVPGKDGSVRVEGAITHPGALQFMPGWKAEDYVAHAGGLALGAAGDRTHVIGPDGFVIGAHRRFWFDPAVAPGSTIVVPQTPAPEPATVTEGDRWNHPWLGWAIALVAGLGLGVGL
jgi:polysaccharide export outer membrane protein